MLSPAGFIIPERVERVVELAQDDYVTLASAATLVLLGGGLLLVRPIRREQGYFTAFTWAWAAQTLAASFGNALGGYVLLARTAILNYALFPLVGLLALAFAASVRHVAWTSRVLLAYIVLAVLGPLLLLIQPDWIVVVEAMPPPADARLGIRAGTALLVAFPFYSAFFAALGVLYAHARASPEGAPKQRARQLLIALALYPAYASWRFLYATINVPETQRFQNLLVSGLFLAIFVSCALATIAFMALALFRPPSPAKRDWAMLAAFLVPCLVATIELPFRVRALDLYSFGVWRFATVVIVAYVIARYRLFDIDLKVKRGVKGTTIAAAFFAIFFIVSESATAFFSGSIGTYLGIAAAGLLVFALAPLQRLAERLANHAVPHATGSPDYVAWRKLQVYHAALDGAMQDGEVTVKERAILARLRRELGIADADAEALERDLAGRAGTASTG